MPVPTTIKTAKLFLFSGTYNVWAIEIIFYFVSNTNFLGGNLGFMVMFPTPAAGSLVADINIQGAPNLNAAAGGSGLGDLWLQFFTLGWDLKRLDVKVGDAFMVPTGRYSPRGHEQRWDWILWQSPTDRNDFLRYKIRRNPLLGLAKGLRPLKSPGAPAGVTVLHDRKI